MYGNLGILYTIRWIPCYTTIIITSVPQHSCLCKKKKKWTCYSMSPHVFQLERWLILLLWSFNAIFSVLLCRLHSPELTDPLRSHWWTIWVWNTHTHTRGIKEKYSCHWLLQSPVLCWSRHRGATFLFTTVSYSWVKEAISFGCGLKLTGHEQYFFSYTSLLVAEM